MKTRYTVEQNREIAGFIRWLVRKRDGKCCYCERLTNANGEVLHVHRLNAKMPYTFTNCVALCRACHGKSGVEFNSQFHPAAPPLEWITAAISEILAGLPELPKPAPAPPKKRGRPRKKDGQ